MLGRGGSYKAPLRVTGVVGRSFLSIGVRFVLDDRLYKRRSCW